MHERSELRRKVRDAYSAAAGFADARMLRAVRNTRTIDPLVLTADVCARKP
jgi:hypothetical protein